ncbi:hypothetical protein BR93DRAFT_176397 [Coniochaeta sp. PMI_546]|nr:hypothetical protein BR93DRAFT_176397 [Coniochaeta sp. PMI_546]
MRMLQEQALSKHLTQTPPAQRVKATAIFTGKDLEVLSQVHSPEWKIRMILASVKIRMIPASILRRLSTGRTIELLLMDSLTPIGIPTSHGLARSTFHHLKSAALPHLKVPLT